MVLILSPSAVQSLVLDSRPAHTWSVFILWRWKSLMSSCILQNKMKCASILFILILTLPVYVFALTKVLSPAYMNSQLVFLDSLTDKRRNCSNIHYSIFKYKLVIGNIFASELSVAVHAFDYISTIRTTTNLKSVKNVYCTHKPTPKV